jgi:predicted  nucleic acid-binding Zn-ribbon protein
MMLAEALRKFHEAGQVHGGVSPASILLAGSGLQLGPAPYNKGIVTPYTAPELLQGQPPDSRSDLFAFGAVVYEMFSGRRAFEGDSPAALSAAIDTSTPPSCGRPAVDRLIRNCLAKDPGARWQRMHKVLMEIKLLSVSARRTAPPAALHHAPIEDTGLRTEMQQLEGRVAARLQACENAVAETQRAAATRREPADSSGLRSEMQQVEGRLAARLQAFERSLGEMQRATTELRGQLAAVNTRLAAACDRQVSIPEGFLEAAEARLAERLGRNPEAGGERILQLEQGLDAVRKHIATLHDSVAEDFLDFEKGLKSQATAIQSARTAMAQTDDLVERVVEALESLQSVVMEPREEQPVVMN